MIVVDTTILLYAVGKEHPLAEPSRRLLSAAHDGRLQATTIVEAIQEFAHVYARRRERRDAARMARDYAQGLSPLIPIGGAELDAALSLFERHPELGAFDALVAAAAIAHDAEALVSADADFAVVPRLRLVRPGTPAFEELLSR